MVSNKKENIDVSTHHAKRLIKHARISTCQNIPDRNNRHGKLMVVLAGRTNSSAMVTFTTVESTMNGMRVHLKKLIISQEIGKR
jgi:hypothetical protein